MLGCIIVEIVRRGDEHHDKMKGKIMSKFDIMRAVADGTMEAPPVPLDLDLAGRPARVAKAKVMALGSMKIKPLRVANRTDWLGEFELRTGQV